jgi:hypothetical protein
MREGKESKGDTKSKNVKVSTAAMGNANNQSPKKSTAPPATEMADVSISPKKGTSSKKDDIVEDKAATTEAEAELSSTIDEQPSTLEERVKQLEEALQAQCDQTQEYYELAQQYESRWKGTAKELLRLRQEGTAVEKVDDDVLVQNWNHIRYLIRTLAQKYYKAQRSVAHYVSRVDNFKHLTLEHKRYMKSRDLRPVLIQAYLFHRLLSQKSGARLLWASDQAEHFRELSRTLQPTPHLSHIPKLINEEKLAASEVQSYQAWRSSTASLVAMRANPKEVSQRVNELTNRVYMEILPYATLRDQQLITDLKEVITRIMELDELFCRSRAIVFVQTWYGSYRGEPAPYEFEFGEFMESEDGFEEAKPGMVVEIVVSQALFKIGNADGGGYDTMNLLSKAHVLCSGTRENMERSGRLK